LLKRNDKVYFEDDFWVVFLNNRNTTKVLCQITGVVYDYFKDIDHKETVVPNYIKDKCVEIHHMWIDSRIDSQKEKRKKAKGKK
jgi:hypothetical protein